MSRNVHDRPYPVAHARGAGILANPPTEQLAGQLSQALAHAHARLADLAERWVEARLCQSSGTPMGRWLALLACLEDAYTMVQDGGGIASAGLTHGGGSTLLYAADLLVSSHTVPAIRSGLGEWARNGTTGPGGVRMPGAHESARLALGTALGVELYRATAAVLEREPAPGPPPRELVAAVRDVHERSKVGPDLSCYRRLVSELLYESAATAA